MDVKTQTLISEHIINEFELFKVNTMDAIGLLEVIKMALYSDTTEGGKDVVPN